MKKMFLLFGLIFFSVLICIALNLSQKLNQETTSFQNLTQSTVNLPQRNLASEIAHRKQYINHLLSKYHQEKKALDTLKLNLNAARNLFNSHPELHQIEQNAKLQKKVVDQLELEIQAMKNPDLKNQAFLQSEEGQLRLKKLEYSFQLESRRYSDLLDQIDDLRRLNSNQTKELSELDHQVKEQLEKMQDLKVQIKEAKLKLKFES